MAARSIMPNAGLPQRIEGQFVYAASPDYLGGMVPRFIAAGAAIVGGCCGTTPEHIAAMRRAIDAFEAGPSEPGGALAAAAAPPRTPTTIRPRAVAVEPAPAPGSRPEPVKGRPRLPAPSMPVAS